MFVWEVGEVSPGQCGACTTLTPIYEWLSNIFSFRCCLTYCVYGLI